MSDDLWRIFEERDRARADERAAKMAAEKAEAARITWPNVCRKARVALRMALGAAMFWGLLVPVIGLGGLVSLLVIDMQVGLMAFSAWTIWENGLIVHLLIAFPVIWCALSYLEIRFKAWRDRRS